MAVFPLPRAPSRRAAGIRAWLSSQLALPASCGSFPISLGEVTAADRAAATMRRGAASADAMRGILSHALCARLLLLRKETRGDFASAEARRGLSDRPRHPFGPLLIDWHRGNTLVGRGGSVSRRDLSQLAGDRTQLAWARTSKKSSQVYSQPLFGREREGGASLREAASLAYPTARTTLREGARGWGFSLEKPPPPESLCFHYIMLFLFVGRILGGGEKKNLSTIIERIVDKCLQMFFPAPAASAC